MFNVPSFFGFKAGSPFDADYQAVLDYATTQSYTLPSASQRLLQEQLIIDLKDAGIWDKLDTFAVFATDGDSDFALIDWKRLTQYTAVNSPTFTTNEGFQGDGSSSWINTNYNAFVDGVNYTLNDASYGYYLRTYDSAAGSSEGHFCAVSTDASWIRYTTKRFYINSSSYANYVNLTLASNQLISANRINANDVNLYSNGVLNDTMTVLSTGIANLNFEVFKRGSTYNDSQISLIYTGANLDSEQSDLNLAWNNYYTSI